MTRTNRRAGDLPDSLRGPLMRPVDLLTHEQQLRGYFIELSKAAGQREEQIDIARNVIGLLARPEEVLSLQEARGLISPLARWLELAGMADALQPELELLARRHPHVTSGLLPRPHIDPLPPAAAVAPPDDDDLEALWLLSGQGDDEWRGEPKEREQLIRRWMELRPSVRDVDVRARADSRLLRFAIERRLRMPIEFAEALYDDAQVWSRPSLREVAAERRRPLSREIGLSASGLINARMAGLNPSLFLTEPEAPITTSTDDAAELSTLRSAQTGQLGEYLLGVTHELDEMLRRRGVITRASVESLRTSAHNTFALLGLRPWLVVGAAVTYDITRHNAVDSMPDGAAARVLRAGLVRNSNQSILVKPVVAPADTRVSPDTASHTAVGTPAEQETPR